MTRARVVLPVLLALLSTAPGAPAVGPDSPLPVPVEEVVLDNGLRLLLSPRPGSPVVAAGWSVATGSAEDADGQQGAAHLLEHMLFQGSGTIGVRDRTREMRIHERQDRLFTEWRSLLASDRDPGGDRERDLVLRIEALDEEARPLALPGELSLLYARAGATRLRATTYPDLGLYSVILPAGRLELWFWLESDRLADPVFRELAREKRVIEEERRQTTTVSASVLLDRALEARFWGPDHPYANDTLGRPLDVVRLSRALLSERFRRTYRPDRLTLALVGGFDPARAQRLAKRYFGRLEALPADGDETNPRPRASRPPEQPADDQAPLETRVVATYDGPAKARLLHPGVAWGDPDRPAYDLFGAILNGRSGRLYRDLVRADAPVFAAWALHHARRLGGQLVVDLETRGGERPEALLPCWERERRRLLDEPPGADELERARQRLLAEGLRSLEEPGHLLRQLLTYGALGSWRETTDWPSNLARVGPEDVQRVARASLTARGRVVALFRNGGPAARSAPPVWRPVSVEVDTPETAAKDEGAP